MARFAIVDQQAGVVVNIVDWDDAERVLVEYPGHIAVASETALVGWSWSVQGLSEPLAELQALALAQVDQAAEDCRRKNLPPGTGQVWTYERKADEATRVQSDPNPVADDYPFLAASVGIDGDTLQDVAVVVIQQAATLASRFGRIEKIRLKAKRDVRQATTGERIEQIKAALVWPNGNGH